MNKKFLILLSILSALNIFAEENTQAAAAENSDAEKESKISFSFDFETEASFNMTGSGNKLAFDSFCFEITDLTFAAAIDLADKLAFDFYIAVPMTLEVGNADTVKVTEVSPELGIGLSFNPTEPITLDFGLAHNLKFEPSDSDFFSVDSGFIASAGFAYENSFFALELSDSFNPLWRITEADDYKNYIDNELEAELKFDFLNFAKKDLNTGLWIYNDLVTDHYFDKNGDFFACSFENELYAGLHTNPVEWFDAKAAFYGDFLFDTNEHAEIVDGSDTVGLGLFLETAFTYKNVGFAVSYTPVLYTVNAESPKDTSHEILARISVSF